MRTYKLSLTAKKEDIANYFVELNLSGNVETLLVKDNYAELASELRYVEHIYHIEGTMYYEMEAEELGTWSYDAISEEELEVYLQECSVYERR